MKSLKAENHLFSDSKEQLLQLNREGHQPFIEKLEAVDLYPLKPLNLQVLQVNLGKMCNQVCKHCHVDAGPDRKEIMSMQTMELCLSVIEKYNIETVDLTGGAPEMNPNFRWFVEQISSLGKKIINRCNLTIINANQKYFDLPQFFAEHNLEIVASLPHYSNFRTDSQRGKGVFDRSIKALKELNKVGYGQKNTSLSLNLVYNPTGAILPGPQKILEEDYRSALKNKFDIDFNNLFVLTNMPISRFLDYLIVSKNYEEYMQALINSFNVSAAKNVMCRNTISVGWDGNLYDCDFNQMLELGVQSKSNHISNFDLSTLSKREIVLNQHCYGCTAGLGSSCGGQIN